MALTLADKVYAVFSGDNSCDAIRGAVDQLPARAEGECHPVFVIDMRDWGVAYGIAFGIARAEDPWEPVDAVAQRAFEAARDAWVKYNGEEETFRYPEPDAAVRRVQEAFRKLNLDWRDPAPVMSRELVDSIKALRNEFGARSEGAADRESVIG